MRRLVVVGDTLLDRDLDGQVERLCPDAPVPVVERPVTTTRPGGAGLAAVLAAAGRPVTLVTALARDEAGAELHALLDAAGVEVIGLTLEETTAQKVRVRAGGRCMLRIDYGGEPARVGPLTEAAAACLNDTGAVLVSDYGGGVTAVPTVRAALAEAARRRPLIWDPHPRGTPPATCARLVTPNQAEAARFSPGLGTDGLHALTMRARALLRTWSTAGVSITLGARGALLVSGDGAPLVAPAPPPATAGPVDSCGAGDRYASRAAGALADGALLSAAVVEAVAAASSFVFAGGVSCLAQETFPASEEGPRQADAVIAQCRARGGTVVATGGCFDLLHAGHVRMLEQARRLGDCLVVCLNSDASVRRLKGAGRAAWPRLRRCRRRLRGEHPGGGPRPAATRRLGKGRRLAGPSRGASGRVVGWPGRRLALPRGPLHHDADPGGDRPWRLSSHPAPSW